MDPTGNFDFGGLVAGIAGAVGSFVSNDLLPAVGDLGSGLLYGVERGFGLSPDRAGSGLSFLAGGALGAFLTSPIQLAWNAVGAIGNPASAAFPSGIGSLGGMGAPGPLLADNTAETVSEVPTLQNRGVAKQSRSGRQQSSADGPVLLAGDPSEEELLHGLGPSKMPHATLSSRGPVRPLRIS